VAGNVSGAGSAEIGPSDTGKPGPTGMGPRVGAVRGVGSSAHAPSDAVSDRTAIKE